jgi:hypothetical protein
MSQEQPASAGTGDSRRQDEHGSAPVGQTDPTERVYAPASARVPKPPAPGHEALLEQVDITTAERRGAPAGTRPDAVRYQSG